jgi:hypothetical protein
VAAFLLRAFAETLASCPELLGYGSIPFHQALELLGPSRDLVAQTASRFGRPSCPLRALDRTSCEDA